VSAAVALCVTGARRSLRFGLVFVGYSVLFTLVLFNVTFVMNELSHPRYVAFIPLILVPLVFLSADAVVPRAAKASLLLLLAVQVYWTGRAAHFLVIRDLPELGFLTDPEESLFVMPDVYIDRAYRSGPPVVTSKGLLVAPMSFEEPPGRRQ
jgi:hypothetical protein